LTIDPTKPLNAREFLELFRSSNDIWHEYSSNSGKPKWVFRGQRDARWNLTPVAWRNGRTGNPLANDVLERTIQRQTPTGQVWTELELLALHHFQSTAWRMGFDVKEPTSYIDGLGRINGPWTLSGELEEAFLAFDFGLAQHYGVPTRFLDWTFNPLNALYFAAEGQPGLVDTDLAVWAYDLGSITCVDAAQWINLHYHLPSRRSNQFIAAQDGLLLEMSATWSLKYFEVKGRWPYMEQTCWDDDKPEPDEDWRPDGLTVWDEHCTLRKLTLAASEIPELRKLLEREGISRERMMPTLDNVAKAALRKALLGSRLIP
jgi:hypothetical protein